MKIATVLALTLLMTGVAPAASGLAAPVSAPPASPAPAPAATPAKKGAEASPAPRDWRELTREGYRRLAKGKVDGARSAFAAALKLQPRAFGARTGMGAVLARKGKLKKAERMLKDALVLNPDPVRTYYELGRVYQQLGDYDRAVTAFKAGIKKYREGRK